MPFLSMRGITKRFPGITANDKVDLDLEEGEVLALLGENGAGKSTLMNILMGLYRPDKGGIFINERQVNIKSPRDSIRLGIGMVHQHFLLVNTHTVIENVVLGVKRLSFFPDYKRLACEILKLGERYNLKVDPWAQIWQLTVGEQQRVEILRCLYKGAKVLILDEPTAVLTPQESEQLFNVIKKMKTEGNSIIFISHKLDEIMDVADRVMVMRKGNNVATMSRKDMTREALANLMIGRKVFFDVLDKNTKKGLPRLSLEGIQAINDRGLPALNGIDLEVVSGEILGVAGVAGNGQTELAEVTAGLRLITSGTIKINGEKLKSHSPREAIDLGLAYLPADRISVGVAPGLGVRENMILKHYRSRFLYYYNLFLNNRALDDFAQEKVNTFSVSTPSLKTPVKFLSGGNIQKIILARELSFCPKVIVAVYPTRGLDIGSTDYIRKELLKQCGQGASILLISESLEELFALSHRIIVLYEGRIMGERKPDPSYLSEIGLMMAGVS